MSKIIELYGTRSDGVTINFLKDDITEEKMRYSDFVSVTCKEVMTKEEMLQRYPTTDKK